MACGCNKNKNARTTNLNAKTGGSIRSIPGGNNSGVIPSQVRSNQIAPQAPINTNGLNAERRKVQALRRDAINRALGK